MFMLVYVCHTHRPNRIWHLQFCPIPGRSWFPYNYFAIIWTRCEDVSKLGMRPCNLPHWTLVAFEFGQRLVVFTRVKNSYAAVWRTGCQQQSIEVQCGMMDHVLMLCVDFLQQADHFDCNLLDWNEFLNYISTPVSKSLTWNMHNNRYVVIAKVNIDILEPILKHVSIFKNEYTLFFGIYS